MFCKDWAALSISISHAYFHSPAISWEIWLGNVNLIVFLLCGTPDTSATWFWFELLFLSLAVASTLIEFKSMTNPELEYLLRSFHFRFSRRSLL